MLGFAQFWLLTDRFPLIFMLVLYGASWLALMLVMALRAFAGLGTKEKKYKLYVLSSVWGMNKPVAGCTAIALGLFTLAFSAFMSLWTFWQHPWGDPTALGWIAFYEFIFPPIVGVFMGMIMAWPMLLSDVFDDDCRNILLLNQVSALVISSVTLLYPAWLFRHELSASLGFVTPVWLLPSIPFLSFLVGGVLPYLVGTWKYRSQNVALLKWRQDWLSELLSYLKMPVGENRSRELDQLAVKIETEIEKRAAEHEYMDLFRKVVLGNESADVQQTLPQPPTIHAEAIPVVEPPPADPAAPAPELIEIPSETATADPATVTPVSDPVVNTSQSHDSAKKNVYDALARISPVAPASQAPNVFEEIRNFIRRNKNNLIEWDASFAHISKLLDLQSLTNDGKSQDFTAFVQDRIDNLEKQISAMAPAKSLLLTAAWGVLTGLPVVFLKLFTEEFADLIQAVMKTHH